MSSTMSFSRAARHLATRAKSVTRGSSGRVAERPTYLNAEIERMNKAYEIYNETPPKPFKLRSSGDLDLLLTRRYNKVAEDIQVKCALVFDPRGGPPDELFEDELEDKIGREQKVVVNITMTITKGGPQALEINVDCDRRGYIVNNIIYRENKNSKHDDEFFPAFWRIGPKLRSGFHNFLEERGLDEIFACWVHDQMDDKAFKERLRLLEKINAFVENEDEIEDEIENEIENEKRS